MLLPLPGSTTGGFTGAEEPAVRALPAAAAEVEAVACMRVELNVCLNGSVRD